MRKGRELFSRALSSPRFFDGGEWRLPAMATEEENDDGTLAEPTLGMCPPYLHCRLYISRLLKWKNSILMRFSACLSQSMHHSAFKKSDILLILS